MKKNDVIISEAVDYSYDGNAICKPEGFVIFVRGLLVGEKAKIVITKLNKHLGFGKVLELITKSQERVNPQCSAYPKCGGCSLRQMSYQQEAKFKEEMVRNTISNISHLKLDIKPIITMDKPENYRNKLQAPVVYSNQKLTWGFYRINSHDLIPLNNCAIEDTKANELINELVKRLSKDTLAPFIRHILIRSGKTSKEEMVVIVTKKSQMPGLKEIAEKFVEDYPEVKTIVQNINDQDTNVILGSKEYTLVGKGYITDMLADLKFRISSKSFYQVNPVQAVKLYNEVKRVADLKPTDVLVDLYCGIGTITLWLARSVKQAIGVEIVAPAIKDAKLNAEENQIKNVRFIEADAGQGSMTLIKEGIKPTIIVVDPPRKGLDQLSIDSIVKLNPQRVVYVSCNPSTLARDLEIFNQSSYVTDSVQPVDMFPRTPHVETVVLLSKK